MHDFEISLSTRLFFSSGGGRGLVGNGIQQLDRLPNQPT